ncbi:hypothetical protein [uncultured Umboniibacter sp.]|uniref:hypothetical protein n=1 Tax=uncultured Umboniibacter sp. TaxID=1798917 RepID=UPI00261EB08F|nr:hypothetical protein [uncultured Umboniibacter sp.]
MYIFSITAVARIDQDGFTAGTSKPFIVYINFADLFGARALAQAYLLKAGFHKLRFDDQKHLSPEQLSDHATVAGNRQIVEALEHGFSLQIFESH